MENASKALLMAGGVLIALLIIGALLLMFNNLSSYQKVGEQDTREAQVIEFNNQFETYNRKNVRGSELYSLLNRVVDYNKRKSIKGRGTNEQGQYEGYTNMKITFSLKNPKDFSADGKENRLLTKTEYTQDATTNDFETNISDTVENLEKAYGAESLTKLAAGLSKIFIDTANSTEEQKQRALKAFNQACKSKSLTAIEGIDVSGGGKVKNTIREDVYTYYEYVQFKRARFDCKSESVKYDENTGRITEMEFEFTEKFE